MASVPADTSVIKRTGAILDVCKNCPRNQSVVASVKAKHAVSCSGCPLYNELLEHGHFLWGDNIPRRAKTILQKQKHHVTKKELNFLLTCDVPKSRIARAFGFNGAYDKQFKLFAEALGVVIPMK